MERADKREIERYLERAFAKARKEISGRGALSTRVRIVEDVIYTKMKMEYLEISKNMFRVLNEEVFYDSVRGKAQMYADKILCGLCEDLKIIAMHFKIDIENDYSFATIVLDGDLESLIENGTVALPDKMHA